MSAAWGALIGLACAAGILIAAAGVLAQRRPSLADRVAPRRRAAALPADLGPAGTLWHLVLPFAETLARWVGRDPGRATALARRLAQAGRQPDVERFRLEQVVWAAAGGAIGVVVALVVLARRSDAPPAAALVVVAVSIGLALLLHDRRLGQAVRTRARRMSEQLPTVAELLAFAVAAGEAPLAALDRVARTVTGELADEISLLVGQVRGGTPFIPALRSLSDRCPSPTVARFVDGVAVATERGTPLSDVLRAQAADARAAGRRALLESAGRKEVLMLVPVVFFILPVIVVIALFPGIHGLTLAVP